MTWLESVFWRSWLDNRKGFQSVKKSAPHISKAPLMVEVKEQSQVGTGKPRFTCKTTIKRGGRYSHKTNASVLNGTNLAEQKQSWMWVHSYKPSPIQRYKKGFHIHMPWWHKVNGKVKINASVLKGNQPSMASDILCWSDSSRSSNPRMSSGSVMIFVVALARTNVSKMHFTWWYWRISPPLLLYGFVTTYGSTTQHNVKWATYFKADGRLLFNARNQIR